MSIPQNWSANSSNSAVIFLTISSLKHGDPKFVSQGRIYIFAANSHKHSRPNQAECIFGSYLLSMLAWGKKRNYLTNNILLHFLRGLEKQVWKANWHKLALILTAKSTADIVICKVVMHLQKILCENVMNCARNTIEFSTQSQRS